MWDKKGREEARAREDENQTVIPELRIPAWGKRGTEG